jgi:acyl-coenzyme A thioesterase PaaI-like protein
MLGMRPKSIGESRARFELEVAARHLNPAWRRHLQRRRHRDRRRALLADRLRRAQCATLEIKMNYLLPVTGESIAAEAAVVVRTRRVGVIEAKVYDDDTLVALATGPSTSRPRRSERDGWRVRLAASRIATVRTASDE